MEIMQEAWGKSGSRDTLEIMQVVWERSDWCLRVCLVPFNGASGWCDEPAFGTGDTVAGMDRQTAHINSPPSPDSRGSTEALAPAAHLPPRRDLTSPRLIGLGLARGLRLAGHSPGQHTGEGCALFVQRAAHHSSTCRYGTGTLPDLRAKSVNEDLDRDSRPSN
ncbi:hypothetical protein VE00_07326 [Pseudogymnoascus sp. WSF 3629]|nr:hypothetical protein VE00_07326 [Pseudogymnoascus sp. WSF 3629]